VKGTHIPIAAAATAIENGGSVRFPRPVKRWRRWRMQLDCVVKVSQQTRRHDGGTYYVLSFADGFTHVVGCDAVVVLE